jgi:hypothetical protein
MSGYGMDVCLRHEAKSTLAFLIDVKTRCSGQNALFDMQCL